MPADNNLPRSSVNSRLRSIEDETFRDEILEAFQAEIQRLRTSIRLYDERFLNDCGIGDHSGE